MPETATSRGRDLSAVCGDDVVDGVEEGVLAEGCHQVEALELRTNLRLNFSEQPDVVLLRPFVNLAQRLRRRVVDIGYAGGVDAEPAHTIRLGARHQPPFRVHGVPLDDEVEVLRLRRRAAGRAPPRRRPNASPAARRARGAAAGSARRRSARSGDEAIGAIIYHPRPMSSPPPRRFRRGLLVALAALLLLAGGAVAFVLANKPGDVSNPDVEFTTETATTAPAPERPQAVDGFLWPTYGYTANRTRDFGGAPDYLRPPFRRGWTYRSGILLEFPPAIEGGTLYLLDDDGMLRAIQKTSGRILWRQRVGRLAAASPAVGDGRVYAVALKGIGSESGRIAAYRAADGRQLWSKALPSRAESSPLLRNGRVFFGSENGTVYALDARSGRTIWTYRRERRSEGRPGARQRHALLRRLRRQGARCAGARRQAGVVGRHERHALRLRLRQVLLDGGRRLRTRLSRQHRQPRLSFSARTGELAWATGTGAYVYGSPAVANTPGLGPTVYIGSYDGNLYAFDARSGAVRWRYGVGQRISGSATIVGPIVYFSNLGTDETHGVYARTGRRAFYFSDGAFNPVVADRRAIYLAGYTNIYELMPKRATPRWRRANEAAVRAARADGEAQVDAQASAARSRRAHGSSAKRSADRRG